MFDKDFMDIILGAKGGEYSEKIYDRIRTSGYNFQHELMANELIEATKNFFLDCEYGDLVAFIDTAYSDYATQGYKIGFNDGIRFMVSIVLGEVQNA